MKFLAACNPFQLIKKGISPDDELVCHFEDPRLRELRLSHRVHPLKHSLLDCVWNFGALGPDEEKQYIRSMLRHPVKKKYRAVFMDIMHEAHQFVKDVEKNVSSVSLRDFARVDKLFGFTLALVREIKCMEKEKAAKSTDQAEFDSFEDRWAHIESDQVTEQEFKHVVSLILGLNYYFRLYSDSTTPFFCNKKNSSRNSEKK